jgi:DNA-binding MarR family transcriptional regulator
MGKRDYQHVQLPNDMTKSGELSQKDLLVYVTIKRYMNSQTRECYPSLDTIVKVSGVSKPTVRKAINNLKRLKYLDVRLEGRKNVYKFNPHKNFEPFSYEFLDFQLETNLKAYIMVVQQTMYKDVEGYGKVSYSDSELASIINLDRHTIAKYNKSLEEQGFLSIVKTDKKDPVTGLRIDEKIFHLNELGQAIIWTLQKHEEDIQDLKEKTEATSKDVEFLLNEIKRLNEKLDRIEEKSNEITL